MHAAAPRGEELSTRQPRSGCVDSDDLTEGLEKHKGQLQGMSKALAEGKREEFIAETTSLLVSMVTELPVLGPLLKPAVARVFAQSANAVLAKQFKAWEEELDRRELVRRVRDAVAELIEEAHTQLVRSQHASKDEILGRVGELRADLAEFREDFAARLAAAGVRIEQGVVTDGAIGVLINKGVINNFHGGAARPAEENSEPERYRCMPQKPAGFIPRKELDELVEELRKVAGKDANGSVGITTALQGAGGFGKTTLAQALCHDARVREAFPGGILWITLGEELSDEALTDRILGLLRWWSDEEPPNFKRPEEAAATLAGRLSGKGVLVVVDDVWKRRHLEPFLNRGLSLLVTTRDRTTLPRDCDTKDVDSMQASEATALLERGLKDAAEIDFGPLAKRLGYWPLLLGLANGRLRNLVEKRRLSVSAALERVSARLDRLGLKAFDEKNAEDRAHAVELTIRLSLDCLDEDERRCYERLAIFPEDVALPIAMLTRYWWPEDGELDAAEDLCERLADLSLVQHLDLARGTVRLHDVFRQYLTDSQRDTMHALHAAWLDALRPGSGRWSDLSVKAAYAWQYLAYHLRDAGQVDELADLLFDYAWLEAKLRPGWLPEGQGSERVNALLSDFAHLPVEHTAKYDATLVQGALRLSSQVLAYDAAQLPGQLIGRLAYFERAPETRLARLLAQSRGPHGHAWLKPLAPNLTAPGGALQWVFTAHRWLVTALACSADGRFAVSRGIDRKVKLWDLGRGQEVAALSGYTDYSDAVACSADGHRVVMGGYDGKVVVWDLGYGGGMMTLSDHLGEVLGRTMLSDYSGQVRAIACSGDGRRAVSGGRDGKVVVWDLERGQQEAILVAHTEEIFAVACSADGRRAVSGASDGKIMVWDLERGRKQMTLSGHTGNVVEVACSEDGQRAISGASDGTVVVWDLERGQPMASFSGHVNGIMAVACSADGRRAVSACIDGKVKLWDLERGDGKVMLSVDTGWGIAAVCSVDGLRAVSGGADGKVRVWDLNRGQQETTLSGHAGSMEVDVETVACSVDGRRAVLGTEDGRVVVWDVDGEQILVTLLGHKGRVDAVACNADGLYVVSGSPDGTMKVWDVDRGHEKATLSGRTDGWNSVACTADGKRAVSVTENDELVVWDLLRGRDEMTLSGHEGIVNAVACSLDGRRAVSAAEDETLMVWDLEGGAYESTLSGHLGAVNAVALSADGWRAVSGGDDGTVMMWDLEKGEEVATLFGHRGRVMAVAYGADGRHAVSGGSDGMVAVWDLERARCLVTFLADASVIGCAMVGRDGIVALDHDGRVHFLRFVEAKANE